MIRTAAAVALLAFVACLVRFLVTPEKDLVAGLFILSMLLVAAVAALFLHESECRQHARAMAALPLETEAKLSRLRVQGEAILDIGQKQEATLDEVKARLSTLEAKAAFGG